MHSKRLSAYSAMAAYFILAQKNTEAQAVYVDIDPDTIIHVESVFDLDIDMNGSYNYRMTNSSFTSFYLYAYGGKVDFQGVNIFGLFGIDQIAAYTQYNLGGTDFYASALNSGALIDPGLSFYKDDIMAFSLATVIVGNAIYGGNWFPVAEDKYLGIKFLSTDGAHHYGWIRCSVEDAGRVVIVKDYAYELKPDVGIHAGDMVGDTTTVSVNTLQATDVSIYAFNKSVYIHLPQLPEPNTQVLVYDMLGREIYRQGIETTSTQIHLNTAAGIYLVTIQNGENTWSKKVLVE